VSGGLGPIIHWKLTHDPRPDLFKRWVANHLPLIQRHGGNELYGIGLASEILFGRTAQDLARDKSPLSIAEQYVLAGAVNQPVGLLPSQDLGVETIRVKSWQRIVGRRAQECRKALLAQDPGLHDEVDKILSALAEESPKPQLALGPSREVPSFEGALAANPVRRAINLALQVQYGANAELKDRYGPEWRNSVQEVQLTLDIKENYQFERRIKQELERLQQELSKKLRLPLVRGQEAASSQALDVVVVAADLDGRIVRYFELAERASYFGSAHARDSQSGLYRPQEESRQIASAGKLLAAIAIANQGEDTPETVYATEEHCGWPCSSSGLNCSGPAYRVFARSQSAPIQARLEHLGLDNKLEHLATNVGLNRIDTETPMTTAAVCGYLGGSPRTVHRLAGLLLAALSGQQSH
jgi:penicillin-binding protein 1A